MAETVFKKEYVLGRGYPWGRVTGYHVVVCPQRQGRGEVKMVLPVELWGEDAPRYELVLRRVREDD